MRHPGLVLLSESIDLGLIVADSLQELTIGLLSGQELLHDLLDISTACVLSDGLECLLIFLLVAHLLLHLLLEEGTPEPLYKE